jgi:hypothetical protein
MLRRLIVCAVLALGLAATYATADEEAELAGMKPASTQTVTRCNPHCYSTAYLFPVTRGMMNYCLDPAATAALSPLTIVADVLLLPFGVVMGLFG